MSYLEQLAGHRTVPVEVGRTYLEEGWGTQLMTLQRFLRQHVQGGTAAAAAGSTAAAAPIGYLAQHQLFDQIPELRRDIGIPDYCALGEEGVSSINAWLGPAGTVTPLHTDPKHNFLAQVVGSKYIRLYSPQDTAGLYPHEGGMHTNTSQVDLEVPDKRRFPKFQQTPYIDCVLNAGDMLYMPPGWWHFVKALTVSFSVSFWWS